MPLQFTKAHKDAMLRAEEMDREWFSTDGEHG